MERSSGFETAVIFFDKTPLEQKLMDAGILFSVFLALEDQKQSEVDRFLLTKIRFCLLFFLLSREKSK